MTSPIVVATAPTGVVTLTLNRPYARNALDRGLLLELRAALRAVSGSGSTRAVVLTGAGDVFCAGADLAEIASTRRQGPEVNRVAAELLSDTFREISACPVPTVARVNGHAFGGGAGLVACCDLAAAQEDALLGFGEARLGLVPALVAPWVIEAVGARRARELFLTGSRIPALEAANWGLITVCVPRDELDTAVNALVEEILLCAPRALARTKRMLGRLSAMDGRTVHRAVEDHLEARMDDEAGEGIKAFFDQRRPAWVVHKESDDGSGD